jgi:hypothetical protein
MEIEVHNLNNVKIARIISDSCIIKTIEDGSDLLGNLYYQGYEGIVLNEKNITPEFFNLKNGIAGEIFQKFTNYRMRLAIIGDFTGYSGRSLGDFIYESNKKRQIIFMNSETEALNVLCGR